MNLKELNKLVKQGETDRLEFKKTTGQRTSAAKTVCAFLNGHGGRVLFGVTDAGKIAGQKSGNKTLEDLSRELKKIDPSVSPDINTVQLENGNAVIVVAVKKGDGPYALDGRPYERTGAVTQVMSRESYERRLIERMHPTQRWENQPVCEGVTISDLDEEEIQTLLANAARIGRMETPRHTDTESILRGLDLIQDEKPLNAAVVLFGRDVWSYFPQCEIRMARFRGTSRRPDFSDNRQYNGNAFSLLRRAERFLLDHVPIAGRVIPGKMIREDYPWYPPSATREALANAICHRDYTIPGGAVSLAMHDDRLEISNPGEFHFGITPEKLKEPHESKPWNPLIANAFYRAGIIERWGSGTTNIVSWCEENGNPIPQWQERAGSVVLTFLPLSDEKPTEVSMEVAGEVTGEVTGEVQKFLKILHTPMSRSEAQTVLSLKGQANFRDRYLKPALDLELVEMTIPDKPKSRLQKYRLTKKGKAWFDKYIGNGK
ncbi:MAG: putative DNA binding domain-containing protein [Desulfobacteraceae bacterium]|nr:putative DNA binding domain-containing protein [Desulfobacteraceae bacterium]